MIYFTLALSSFTLEMLIWWLIPKADNTIQWFQRHGASTVLPRSRPGPERHLNRAYSGRRIWQTAATSYIHKILNYFKRSKLRDLIEMSFLRFCDVVNSTWLAYLVCAQTFGADQNCDCLSSNWGPNHVRHESTARVSSPLLTGLRRDTSISKISTIMVAQVRRTALFI